MSVVDFIEGLIARGFTLEQAFVAARLMEDQAACLPTRTSRQDRNARYYQARKERLKASESVLHQTDKTDQDENGLGTAAIARAEPEPNTLSQNPSKNPPKGGQKGSPAPLPADFEPRPNDWTWAIEQIGGVRAIRELGRFRDYWPNRTGKAALKSDWNAAWRNWIRNASDKAVPHTGPPGKPVHRNGRIASLQSEFDGDPFRVVTPTYRADPGNRAYDPISGHGGPDEQVPQPASRRSG